MLQQHPIMHIIKNFLASDLANDTANLPVRSRDDMLSDRVSVCLKNPATAQRKLMMMMRAFGCTTSHQSGVFNQKAGKISLKNDANSW